MMRFAIIAIGIYRSAHFLVSYMPFAPSGSAPSIYSGQVSSPEPKGDFNYTLLPVAVKRKNEVFYAFWPL